MKNVSMLYDLSYNLLYNLYVLCNSCSDPNQTLLLLRKMRKTKFQEIYDKFKCNQYKCNQPPPSLPPYEILVEMHFVVKPIKKA